MMIFTQAVPSDVWLKPSLFVFEERKEMLLIIMQTCFILEKVGFKSMILLFRKYKSILNSSWDSSRSLSKYRFQNFKASLARHHRFVGWKQRTNFSNPLLGIAIIILELSKHVHWRTLGNEYYVENNAEFFKRALLLL